MIFITGGAFQGKREYAVKRFGLSESDITDGGSCELPELKTARCITGYELAVRRMMRENIDPLAVTAELECDIIIMNEIGSGIIPLEKDERVWREQVGRAGCIIAEKADEAVRVCCGIATVIKGKSNDN